MKSALALVASLGVIVTVPALAGSAPKAKSAVETTKPIAASSRTTEIHFDLDKTGPVSAQLPPQDSNAVFAARNEVSLEDYSFELK